MKGRKAMKRKLNLFWCLVVMALFIITSCAAKGTSFTSVWRDKGYGGGNLKKVLVIGASKKPRIRQMFEDEFVKQLKAQGSDGVASHTMLSPEKMLEKDAILEPVRRLNLDSVLITKLIDREDAIKHIPAQHKDINSQYVRSYNYAYNRGYILQDQAVSLEINLYDARSQTLIWSALSETFTRGSDDEVIKKLIVTITEELRKENLL
jgi:hypothetical protein